MLNVEPLGWNRLGSTDLLEVGHELGKTELLFEKIEDDVIQAQIDKLLQPRMRTKKLIIRQNRFGKISLLMIF